MKSDIHTSNQFEREETICDAGELMDVEEDFMDEDIEEDVIKK